MAGMDIDTVVQDLNRRFSVPLSEFYKRRIIFWYDDDKEFLDRLDDIQLPNAKLYVLTGNNSFAAKKLLSREDTTSNYLVYCPDSSADPEKDCLLDVKLYSEDFRADLISIWMDELHIPATATMRKQMKSYRKYFSAKERRMKIMKLKKAPETPGQLHLSVMAGICGTKDAQTGSIIRSVIEGGLNIDENETYQKLVNFGADQVFWSMVAQMTGYSEDTPSIERLVTHLLLTAATRTMPQDSFAGLDSFINIPHQPYCYDFVTDWLHSEGNEGFYHIARYVEEEVRLFQRFMGLPVEQIADTECFPCINEVILLKLMKDIGNDLINTDLISSVVEKRRGLIWYEYVKNYYMGIQQVANMQAFYKTHGEDFHMVEPKKIWDAYTSEYYMMDTWYRKFHLSFQNSLTSSNELLDDPFKHVVDKVEGLYSGWFLGKLGENWTQMCAAELEQTGKIEGVKQQVDFYNNMIKPADTKVFVIISDAMRYEVAAELSLQLQQESHDKVTLSSVEGIFPTITKYGMAALLPHKELTIEYKNDATKVMADGKLTDSQYRDGILKDANPKSVALKYKDIISMKRDERSELVKGMDVVYIYHDTIDESSHTSDTSVFPACEDTITQLKNMVRIIINEFSGIRILITADHGFLYTYSPLKEDSKVGKDSFTNRILEYGRRFAILSQGDKPDYLMPIMLCERPAKFDGYAPMENIRIKMNGGGMNFVHGGASLQEMVVPVIDYRHYRNDNKQYQRKKAQLDTKPVTLALLSASRKITNMIFSLNFYQQEAVSGNREAATYQVYFTDVNGKKISDVQKIIADKANADVQERTFRCNFSLKSQQYKNTDTYYLVIADETGLQQPIKEEFQIDIAFATDDFNFFS